MLKIIDAFKFTVPPLLNHVSFQGIHFENQRELSFTLLKYNFKSLLYEQLDACKNKTILSNTLVSDWCPVEIRQGPLLLTWLTLIPAWVSNHIPRNVWRDVTYPLLNLHRWSLRMDMSFHPTPYSGYNYLSMPGLKLNHVSKKGPEPPIIHILCTSLLVSRIKTSYLSKGNNDADVSPWHFHIIGSCESCYPTPVLLKRQLV